MECLTADMLDGPIITPCVAFVCLHGAGANSEVHAGNRQPYAAGHEH
jgi:hypothetical protein